ncbi:MAG: glycosyltransferase [Patescibacteria group bacterium]|nr:glycosyltransferase [Patescibacteria group bacterium]
MIGLANNYENKMKNIFLQKVDRKYWRLRFSIFQAMSNKKSNLVFSDVINWLSKINDSEELIDDLYLNSNSEVVKQGYLLRKKILAEFNNKYQKELGDFLFVIHIPDVNFSPAGYSLFNNIADALEYLGTNVYRYNWDEYLDFNRFDLYKKIFFLSSDNKEFLKKVDWVKIKNYKNSKNNLFIGLTASLEQYGNTALLPRLEWAKKQCIDFYYSFMAPEYFNAREDYKPFFNYDYKILSVEFGANAFSLYPIVDVNKDLDFVFLGSYNEKNYIKYFSKVFRNHVGFYGGMGWKNFKWIDPKLTKYVYSRAKIGLNVHIKNQIDWPSELNERTYSLAACGVPQIVDNPMLLRSRFDEDSILSASNPSDYYEKYLWLLNNKDKADNFALSAQKKVFENYTNLHRADFFIKQVLLLNL